MNSLWIPLVLVFLVGLHSRKPHTDLFALCGPVLADP